MSAFSRAEHRWMTPPDPESSVCTCGHSIELHEACPCAHGCDEKPCGYNASVCSCDGFVELDRAEARRDHEFHLADQAWSER